MKAKVGQTGHASIQVGNPGSVALYFHCTRSKEGPVRTGEGVSSFALSSRKGCILPGTHAELTFSFSPTKVGIFWEQWELSSMPQAGQAVWPLLLRAIALEDDQRKQARLALDQRLRQQECNFQVRLNLRLLCGLQCQTQACSARKHQHRSLASSVVLCTLC